MQNWRTARHAIASVDGMQRTSCLVRDIMMAGRNAAHFCSGVKAAERSVFRGSIPFEASRKLRFEVHEARGASEQWGMIWTHGVSGSMRNESDGGWPFAGVTTLADIMPVARYDARGHGISDSPATSNCTWAEMGKDLLKLKRAWGRKRTILAGTSMGTAASLFAILEDSTSIDGLILASPPTCYAQRKKFLPMYRKSVDLARASGLGAAKQDASQRAKPPIFLQSEQGRATFDVGWRQKFAMGLDRYCAAFEGAMMSDLPPIEQLRTINVPTLILAWGSDVQHPLETANMLQGTLPHANLHVARTWNEIEDFPLVMRTFLLRCVAE